MASQLYRLHEAYQKHNPQPLGSGKICIVGYCACGLICVRNSAGYPWFKCNNQAVGDAWRLAIEQALKHSEDASKAWARLPKEGSGMTTEEVLLTSGAPATWTRLKNHDD